MDAQPIESLIATFTPEETIVVDDAFLAEMDRLDAEDDAKREQNRIMAMLAGAMVAGAIPADQVG